MYSLQTELLSEFQELIYGHSSLRFSPSRLINLETQLRERVTTLGVKSYEDYLSLVQSDPDEFHILIDAITTKETHFFRMPQHFKALNKLVLPKIEDKLSNELIAGSNGGGSTRQPLHIWSAGCATGEESYSISMAALEGLKYPRAWKVEVFASDISHEAVKKASRGIYEKSALERIPEDCMKKYVNAISDEAHMSAELKSIMSFRVFNLRNLLMDDYGSSRFFCNHNSGETKTLKEFFNVIFCRNVMIYFDIPAQQHLIERLYDCLKPGGFLFTGEAELLHIYDHGFITVESDGALFYQKPE